MTILTLIVAMLAGALAGAVASLVLTWLLRPRQEKAGQRARAETFTPDPAVLADIDKAAKAWANAQGRPDTAADLVADKLRLVYELTQRRRP